MNLPKYPVIAEHKRFYEFVSVGPKGGIKKVVIYLEIEDNLYNLAFGDWNESLNRLDDSTRSNNEDRDKILATVASTAIDFTDRFPYAEIFTEGSTPSRTRLYQMGISKNLEAVSKDFDIQGYVEGEWVSFQKGVNYEAFLVKRKEIGKFE